MRLLIAAVVAAMFVQCALAGPADLSSILGKIRQEQQVPALAGAIVDGEALMAIGAVGTRKIGSDRQVTIADQFHIGSCTKAMTATLCAILVEEKKLRWDSTLAEVFPELAPRMGQDWKAVTLQELLTHRSGLPEDRVAGPLLGKLRQFDARPLQGRDFLLEQLMQKPLEHPPGEKFAYSNFGYTLAGHMAERVTGKPYEQLMRERLFEPLGMKSAGFGPPGSPKAVEQPWGHDQKGTPWFGDNPLTIAPGGCVHCTMEDWARFVAIHAHYRKKAKLLSPQTFDRLHRPADEQSKYAMGWIAVERDWAGGTALTHNGTNTRWFAVAWLAPERDFAVIVACNQGGSAADKACDKAAYALILEHARLKAASK